MARSASTSDPRAGARAPQADAPAGLRPALLALVFLLALTALLPGTWGWSLHLLRFVAPLRGWLPWALVALTLVPPLAERVAPTLARVAHAFERAPVAGTLFASAVVGMLVFLLPDRTWFTGDFLLRMGAVDNSRDFARIAPQSMPLDLLLHVALPRAMANAGWVAHPGDAARWLGALEAAGLAALVLAAGGGIARGGVSRVLFAAAAVGGAGLSLFAGYGKSAGEMVLLTIAIAMFARRFASEGKGAARLGIALALAIAVHRSGLLLAPAWAAAWLVAARSGRARVGVGSIGLGLVLPLAVLAALGPRLVGLLVGFDLAHHLPGAHGSGRLAPIALLDRANLVLFFAPLSFAWGLMAIARGARPLNGNLDEKTGSRAVELALLLPALAFGLLVSPQQGLFRDWDVFAIPGTLLALASAAGLARAIGATREPARAALPVVAFALLFAWLPLAHANDTARGLERVRAFALEAPRRSDAERGKIWEFLGDRAASLGRWEDAARDLREAVVDEPSPRLYTMLAMAEEANGRPEAAQEAWRMAWTRDPSDSTAALRLITIALQRGDSTAAKRAAEELLLISPRHETARRVLGRP